ncbi:hypothetical protein GJAV_G00243290 [Gymnothorax javanicus]|nr:hypothetical protein GJAV_G00243290 [Gymnothorax javanicus]
MAPKRKGPLQTLQRNVDDIKKQVDSLTLEVDQFKVSPEGKAVTEASERCTHLQRSVAETMMTLKKLTKADEPAPVGSYDQRTLDEENRLKMIQERLQVLELRVSAAQPPGPSQNADGPSSSQTEEDDGGGAETEAGEGDEEGDDDDDDDDGEDEEQEKDLEKQAETFITINAFIGEEEGDLTVQKGTLLKILCKNPDGWWLARDPSGNEGLVPKTFLKLLQDEEEEDEEEEDSETEEENEEMDEVSRTERSSQRSSGWDVVRKEVLQMNATDVLAAMGAIPPGFRPSALSDLLSEGDTYRGSRYLQPALSPSRLAFKDLFWDPNTGTVRPRPCRVSLPVTLWSCRMIPSPGVGVQVLSRHVRLCLFDGAKVLSNIHTVRATFSSKNPKTWTFSPRMVGILPSLLDGECFVRSDSQSPDLGILFELGVTYIRNSTGERGDLSCGWALLRLFDSSGAPVPHRTYELSVHGGSPYERWAEVDPSTARGGTGSTLQQMLVSRKQPKLVVKLKSPNSKTRERLNLLPDTLVGSLCSVQLLGLYRQVLADALLRDRLTMQNADLICSPVLATFPQVIDQTDLLDALRSAWAERESALRRSEKQNTDLLKALFVEVYMDTVLPLLRSSALPPPRWADDELENQRARAIFSRPAGGALPTLLSADYPQEPFDMAQVSYDFLCPVRATSAVS